MPKFVDLTNQKFGKLRVISRFGYAKDGHITWLCLCECGNEKIVAGNRLRGGYTRSCGCLSGEIAKLNNTRHGHNCKNKISPTYHSWMGMKQRCNNSNHKQYKNYGARKIKVCKRWLEPNGQGFLNFLKDMGEKPGKKYSIERINNDLGYFKENCKWATRQEQSRNTRQNINITFNGKTQCLKDWSIELNINYNTLYNRLHICGWSIEEAFTTSVRKRKDK